VDIVSPCQVRAHLRVPAEPPGVAAEHARERERLVPHHLARQVGAQARVDAGVHSRA
jgi:hypothetical protein